MAKLPSIKRVSREDIKQAPGWIELLLTPMNTVFESLYSALNKNLTFSENIASQQKELEFTTASDYVANGTFVPLTFQLNMKYRPFSLQICQIIDQTTGAYIPIKEPVSCAGSWLNLNGVITVSYITGLADSRKYKVVFLLL